MSGYMEDLHYQASLFESSYGDGWREGRKEGREEGREEEKRAIARNLIGVLSMEVIAEKTGLSPEVIQRLIP